MAKPSITKRSVKGAALTYAELDTNFQNLADATVAVTGDSGTITNDLNGSFQIAGGTGLTSSVSGSILTVNLDNTAVTAGSYTAANITVDAQGRITAAANGSASGSGTVNSGISGYLSYYPSTGTTIDDTALKYYTASGVKGIQAEGTDDTQIVSSGPGGYVAVSYGGDIVLATSTGSTISAIALNLNVGSTTSGSTANIRPGPYGAARTLSLFGRSGSADGASLSLDSAATITTVSNGNISLSPNGTGKVVIDGLSWPTADGTANQVLKTDGAGNLSWGTTIYKTTFNANYSSSPEYFDIDNLRFGVNSSGQGYLRAISTNATVDLTYALVPASPGTPGLSTLTNQSVTTSADFSIIGIAGLNAGSAYHFHIIDRAGYAYRVSYYRTHGTNGFFVHGEKIL